MAAAPPVLGHGDDDLAACVSLLHAAPALGRAGQRVRPVQDRCELAGLDETGEGEQVLPLLLRGAAQATRQPAAYYDVTVSFSKSISVLHASLRENERRARMGGDQQAAAYWAAGRARSPGRSASG